MWTTPSDRNDLPAIDRVVDDLRALVLGGRFAADSRLGEEAAAEALGVSRTPVRYALATLEQEGCCGGCRGAAIACALSPSMRSPTPSRCAANSRAWQRASSPSADCRNASRRHRSAGARIRSDRWKEATHSCRSANLGRSQPAIPRSLVHATGNIGLITAYEQVKRIPLVSPRAMLFDTGNIELSRAQLTRAQDDHVRVMDAIRARRSQRAARSCATTRSARVTTSGAISTPCCQTTCWSPILARRLSSLRPRTIDRISSKAKRFTRRLIVLARANA